jgi:hypothetical protein
MPEISTKEYVKAYSFTTGAVIEMSIGASYPDIEPDERKQLALEILNNLAARWGYRLEPLIPFEEHDGGE